MSLPANITPIAVSAAGFTGPDGTGWTGVVIFQPVSLSGSPVLLTDTAGSGIVGGPATGTLSGGIMPAVDLVTTDCAEVSPTPFAYNITIRLQTPDGPADDQLYTGVSIPSTLGTTADLSKVLP